MASVAWPAKTRELHNHHFDSTVWNEFRFRDNDIIIATYAKSGTTWLQTISLSPTCRLGWTCAFHPVT
jgi:aryl sulfotransferase